MKSRFGMDTKMKKLVLCLQDGIPICAQPYALLGEKTSLSEAEVIARIEWLRKKKIVKRMDVSMDTRALGIESTLVGCKIPARMIAKAAKVIAAYGNITHNYLRRHRLNMWFTLSAASKEKLDDILAGLAKDLRAEEMVSLPTEEVFKLRLRLDVA